jgi:hypothetical protein
MTRKQAGVKKKKPRKPKDIAGLVHTDCYFQQRCEPGEMPDIGLYIDTDLFDVWLKSARKDIRRLHSYLGKLILWLDARGKA